MPSKEQVRQWMQQRQVEHKPPPTPEQVRQQLGWHLLVKAPECAR
jgi:hypothetical protein